MHAVQAANPSGQLNGTALFVLKTGSTMCLLAGGYLLLLLRVWPRGFLRRFPDEVRAAVPPLSPRERILGTLISLPLLLMLLGFPAATAWAFRSGYGFEGFMAPFFGAYAVWMLFNLFDWLVLDELLLGVLRPGWLVLKGAEHVPLRFDRVGHAVSFLRGSVGGAVVCAVIALAVGNLPL